MCSSRYVFGTRRTMLWSRVSLWSHVTGMEAQVLQHTSTNHPLWTQLFRTPSLFTMNNSSGRPFMLTTKRRNPFGSNQGNSLSKQNQSPVKELKKNLLPINEFREPSFAIFSFRFCKTHLYKYLFPLLNLKEIFSSASMKNRSLFCKEKSDFSIYQLNQSTNQSIEVHAQSTEHVQLDSLNVFEQVSLKIDL
jgi:hypothetical protein